jgi:hypothetical protein
VGWMVGWFKSWSFLRFRNAKGFFFFFLTWCLAVLDFSEESSVLGFLKNNKNGLGSNFTTNWNLGFSSGRVLEKNLKFGFCSR